MRQTFDRSAIRCASNVRTAELQQAAVWADVKALDSAEARRCPLRRSTSRRRAPSKRGQQERTGPFAAVVDCCGAKYCSLCVGIMRDAAQSTRSAAASGEHSEALPWRGGVGYCELRWSRQIHGSRAERRQVLHKWPASFRNWAGVGRIRCRSRSSG